MRDFAPGRIHTNKPATSLQEYPENEKLVTALGFKKREASIDELESMLSLLTDIQEQFWAKTRSD